MHNEHPPLKQQTKIDHNINPQINSYNNQTKEGGSDDIYSFKFLTF